MLWCENERERERERERADVVHVFACLNWFQLVGFIWRSSPQHQQQWEWYYGRKHVYVNEEQAQHTMYIKYRILLFMTVNKEFWFNSCNKIITLIVYSLACSNQ